MLFQSPILLYSDFHQLLALEGEYYRHQVISLNFKPEEGLEAAIVRICDEAKAAAKSGTVLLVLSDRDISADTLPIPAAMAVGAVQRTLVDNNLRCDANILVETASCRDPHHFSVLLGFGATAIYPYLAYETLAKQVEEGCSPCPCARPWSTTATASTKGL